ncbi:hypothetical protein TSAR_012919 [Trichomalopsis sarcophagae]|uniref:Mutator-like transposase domain-containing protein n=1 Tax=Trichomalopsis sarcophagae TaxID=543379 RepID=A0A232EED4_9HYME|nr:hypothetical protein TSAR_012919 [Trichomalopsis sarcophagae]
MAKRLSTALREIVKSAKAKRITLGGKSAGALTNKVIGTLSGYYRNAIVGDKNNVRDMQKQIIATLYHSSSTDKKHNHSLCPQGKQSWCFYKRAVVVENILPIYERLSNEELLARCTQGFTQNANEAIHSVLWRKCPKNNFSSKTRVEIAAAHALSEYNLGRQRSAEILASITSSKMTSHAEKITTQKDKKKETRLTRNMNQSLKLLEFQKICQITGFDIIEIRLMLSEVM